MNHEELLAKIDELRKNNISQEISNDAECMALRKIIELHSPRGTKEWTYCQVCHNNNEYPCSTLKIIEEVLP